MEQECRIRHVALRVVCRFPQGQVMQAQAGDRLAAFQPVVGQRDGALLRLRRLSCGGDRGEQGKHEHGAHRGLRQRRLRHRTRPGRGLASRKPARAFGVLAHTRTLVRRSACCQVCTRD